jgi:hypothetical protein
MNANFPIWSLLHALQVVVWPFVGLQAMCEGGWFRMVIAFACMWFASIELVRRPVR